MTAQSNVILEKCVLFKFLCGVWRKALTAGQMEVIFGHTDKSNTSFESVKTLHLFVCTHNNNKTLRFCKIMKANRMSFLLSRSL